MMSGHISDLDPGIDLDPDVFRIRRPHRRHRQPLHVPLVDVQHGDIDPREAAYGGPVLP